MIKLKSLLLEYRLAASDIDSTAERIFQKYYDKDWFGTKALIKQTKEQMKGRYTDAQIEQHYYTSDKNKTIEYLRSLAAALLHTDESTLKKRLRYDQTMSLEFIEELTGDKWKGLSNKQLDDKINQWATQYKAG